MCECECVSVCVSLHACKCGGGECGCGCGSGGTPSVFAWKGHWYLSADSKTEINKEKTVSL